MAKVGKAWTKNTTVIKFTLSDPKERFEIANLIATSAYWLTRLQVQQIARYTHGVVNTSRPFSYYRKVFFNDRSEVSILETLQGKKLVDIGCGYTPYAEDSMFRACYLPFRGSGDIPSYCNTYRYSPRSIVPPEAPQFSFSA